MYVRIKLKGNSGVYSPITFTMKPTRTNCIFCDSTSHDFKRCTAIRNSSNKIMRCMQSETCPDFNSFTTKELKLVAYLYPFEEGISHHQEAYFINGYGKYANRKMVRNQIPLTLSKRRMVDALCKRWASLQPVVTVYKSKPEKGECPICYDTFNKQLWFGHKWRTSHTNSRINNYFPIKTKCGHIFCNPCWGRIQPREISALTCPMCRTTIRPGEFSVLDKLYT